MFIRIPSGAGVAWEELRGAEIAKVRWLLSTCCLQSSRSETGVFALSHQVLKHYCGRDYARLRNYLCEVGFIVPVMHTNGCLYYDGHARLFRIAAHVDLSKTERVRLPGSFTRKARESIAYHRDEVCDSLDGGRDLLRCLDRMWLDVDAIDLEAVVRAEKKREPTASELFARRQTLETGLPGRARYHDLTGRLYNDLTNLPRELRPFVRVKGVSERLAFVDARSCHPFILACLYWQASGDREPMKVAASGTFWAEVCQYCPELSEGQVKKQVLASIYDCRSTPYYEGGKALVRAFPGFWEWICKQDRKPGSGHLSHRVSRIEGEWFIGAAVELHRATGQWVATLHDCLVVPWQYVPITMVYLQDFPLKKWGVIPSFHFC